MELFILRHLNYELSAPTSNSFLLSFALVCDSPDHLVHLGLVRIASVGSCIFLSVVLVLVLFCIIFWCWVPFLAIAPQVKEVLIPIHFLSLSPPPPPPSLSLSLHFAVFLRVSSAQLRSVLDIHPIENSSCLAVFGTAYFGSPSMGEESK